MNGMLPLTTLCRNEFIDTISFTENTIATLRTNGGLLPNDRFYKHLILEFRGRLTMPGATGPTAVQGDGYHAAIIERVTIEGFHKVRGQQEKFVDMRGSDLEIIQRSYLPGTLIKTPTAISVTASATNDMIIQIAVPFVPLRMPASVQAQYLLDAPNYESLKLTVQWGDFKSVVVPGSTAATWSAYGSATGSPELRVIGGFALHPTRFSGFVPGRIWYYFQEVTGTIPTTTATGVRLLDIPRGFGMRKVALKTGVKATNTTAGNNSYSSLTDFLTELRVNLGLGKYIRRFNDGNGVYADLAESYNLSGRTTGFNAIDFAQYGAPGEVLQTRDLISGPNGNVDLYLQADVTGASNQAILANFEEWRYLPTFVRGQR